MDILTSSKLPESGPLSNVRVIYCDATKQFYAAVAYSSGNKSWTWSPVTNEEVIRYIKAGWTATGVINAELFLEGIN